MKATHFVVYHFFVAGRPWVSGALILGPDPSPRFLIRVFYFAPPPRRLLPFCFICGFLPSRRCVFAASFYPGFFLRPLPDASSLSASFVGFFRRYIAFSPRPFIRVYFRVPSQTLPPPLRWIIGLFILELDVFPVFSLRGIFSRPLPDASAAPPIDYRAL